MPLVQTASDNETEGIADFFPIGDEPGSYAEIQFGNSFSFEVVPGDPPKIRKRYILHQPTYAQLFEFQYRLIGFPYVKDTLLFRCLPERISVEETPSFTQNGVTSDPFYICTKILRVVPEFARGAHPDGIDTESSDFDPEGGIRQSDYPYGFEEIEDLANASTHPDPEVPTTGGVIIDSVESIEGRPMFRPNMSMSINKYENWYIDALYEQTFYEVDFRGDSSTYSELNRFTYPIEQSVNQPLKIEELSGAKVLQWQYPVRTDYPVIDPTAGPTGEPRNNLAVQGDIPFGFLVNEDRRHIVLHWLEVPRDGYSITRFARYRNAVNDLPFLGYPKGTILFTDWHVTQRIHQCGRFVDDLQLIFLYYGPGHNFRMNPRLAYQEMHIKGSAAGVGPFPMKHLDDIFISTAPTI